MNTKYDFRTAIELPIGGNCRYFFNHSTLISECDSASEIVYNNQSLFGTQRIGFNSNYELHDGHLIQYDNVYAIHDEGSSANCYYKHVYDNLIVEYKKGKHVQYLSKPLGCGSNFNADIIIQNCIFKTDNQEVADVSWHFNGNADYKFTIINNYFSHQEMFGIYSAMRNGFDIINATANKNAFDLYKYSRDNKDELAGQIGELKTEVAVLKATRPYQDALIQCDIRRVAEHADFNLWRRTCRMISGEVVLPNTPTVTGYASYNPCDCRNNSAQTPAA